MENLHLLSHHDHGLEAHCLAVPWRRRRYAVCARCFGILLGALASLPLILAWNTALPPAVCTLGLVDWFVFRVTAWSGHRWQRVVSGALLGHLWAQAALTLLTWEHRTDIYAVGFGTLGVWLLGKKLLRPHENTADTRASDKT